MNRSYNVGDRHHLPKSPGVSVLLISVVVARKRQISLHLCYVIFWEYMKIYIHRSATMKTCPNKLLNHYFINVNKPKIMLLDNGRQFSLPVWLRIQKESDVTTRCLPIKHPDQCSVRFKWELSKFFRISCHDNHTKWAELLPHTEEWLNLTVKRGYSPTELMFREKKHGIFDKKLTELKHETLDSEDLDTKLEITFSGLKRKAVDRTKKEERKQKRGSK